MDSTEWDQRYSSTDRLWSSEPNLFVADRLADVEPGVGLDLASGEGRNAIWLADRGWEMDAVDFSEVAVDRGRRRSDLVEFIEADILDWEPSRTYDLVLIAYLHLMPKDFERLIRRVTGWLSPGGELFMVGHDRSNLDEGVGGPPVLEILWDVDQILEWLGDLRLIEGGVVQRPVEDDGDIVFARDALVRARAPGAETRTTMSS